MPFARPAAPAHPAIWSAAILALAFLAWLAFVGNRSPQELALGAACAVFCAAATLLTWKAMELSIAFDLREVLLLLRLPADVLRDAWLILTALARDLFLGEPAGSHLRAVPFARGSGPQARLRHVLAVAYTSVSPNSIVIGIDAPQNLMLIHQILPRPISTVTRRLGGRA